MASPRDKILITSDELARSLDDPALRLYECTVYLHPLADNSAYTTETGAKDWASGHIPNSAFLDFAQELCDTTSPLRFVVPSADAFAAGASRVGIGEGTRVVLYDRVRNQWAARVWWMLRKFGFDNVRVLDGGMAKWKADGRPISTEPKVYPRANFIARPRPGMVVGRNEVKSAINDPAVHILNALTPEQHAGKSGVTYGRAGRIPGSVCVAARDLIDPVTQTYLPEAELRGKFEGSGVLDGKPIITYCGGGIAASSASLALALLGVDDVSIYTNSMQEWAKDPSLPMETG